MITYKKRPHTNKISDICNNTFQPIDVFLDGKNVGRILKIGQTEKYAYYPKGSNTGGDSFSSIELVKKSIEEC